MSERVQCPHEHSRRCGLAHGHEGEHTWVPTDAEVALTRERDRLRAALEEIVEINCLCDIMYPNSCGCRAAAVDIAESALAPADDRAEPEEKSR